MAKARLSLVLPDYAIFFANELNRGLVPESVNRCLKKARFHADDSPYYRRLLSLFAEQKLKGTDLPIARLRGGSQNSLCADPCYLHPDRDQLLLFYRDLDLSIDEAEAIASRVQPLLNEFDARLTVLEADKWLLECNELPLVDLAAKEGLHGRPVSGYMPSGEGAQDWIRLWNEIQMLLFDCPENQAREAAGKVPINSLWFWGKGAQPSWRAWPHVSGEAPLLKTLAVETGSDYQSGMSEFEQISARQAVHVLAFDPESDWDQQWQTLAQNWLLPAMRALKYWRLGGLELIIPEWGDYKLTPLSSWRFW
ncbi:hypothetical protein [Methylophaga sp.]|uniref:hypothetical protein n=1 Tax=Methylophaga sp. TaxID=2024840 RepID=UPI001401409F|nr:hypothetical protein [Methylophaga sp.]MTI63979.1 hypothetical protein [Methylophaga sp.]